MADLPWRYLAGITAMSIKVTITVERSKRLEIRVEGHADVWCKTCGSESRSGIVRLTETAKVTLPSHVHVTEISDERAYLCLRSLIAGE